jgi:hypothetical protein
MGAEKPRIVHAYPYWGPCSSHHKPVFKQKILFWASTCYLCNCRESFQRRTSLWYRIEALSDLDPGEWKIRGSGILLLWEYVRAAFGSNTKANLRMALENFGVTLLRCDRSQTHANYREYEEDLSPMLPILVEELTCVRDNLSASIGLRSILYTRVPRRLVVILPPLWKFIHDCEVLTRIWCLEN